MDSLNLKPLSVSFTNESFSTISSDDNIDSAKLISHGNFVVIQLYHDKEKNPFKNIKLSSKNSFMNYGATTLICCNMIIKFPNEQDVEKALNFLNCSLNPTKNKNVFTMRTDETSEVQYFHFYSLLSQQQNMMQDYIRTNTYYRAIFGNTLDFKDKVILDVGAGSGILSFFAANCGAKTVYAVEASSMAVYAQKLIEANGLSGVIKIVRGKVEEVEIPEYVDTIVSEPLGYMLLNERMLETYLHAKKWLRPGGRMYPTKGDLHISPFTDEALFMETFNRSSFWSQNSFYGMDLTSLQAEAQTEVFQQPIVDTFDVRICMAKSVKYVIDFITFQEADLQDITIDLYYEIEFSSHLHGLAFWFDVAFIGQTQTIWLSTSPTEPLTHWYQVRCLFSRPLLCLFGHVVVGKLHLKSNSRQSYDVEMTLTNQTTGNTVTNTKIDLKNPYFRYTPGSSVVSYNNSSNSNNTTSNGLDSSNPVYDQQQVHAQIPTNYQDAIVNNSDPNLVNGGNNYYYYDNASNDGQYLQNQPEMAVIAATPGKPDPNNYYSQNFNNNNCNYNNSNTCEPGLQNTRYGAFHANALSGGFNNYSQQNSGSNTNINDLAIKTMLGHQQQHHQQTRNHPNFGSNKRMNTKGTHLRNPHVTSE
ncbi:unnamed protein product [Gordionus sp. m RMFG-2023]